MAHSDTTTGTDETEPSIPGGSTGTTLLRRLHTQSPVHVVNGKPDDVLRGVTTALSETLTTTT